MKQKQRPIFIQTFFDALHAARTEEEVKHAYATYFDVEYNTSDRHDLYTQQVLFEFKYDKHFDNGKSTAQVLAQTLYYVRKLKYSRQPKFDNCVDKPIPPALCLADRNSAIITETTIWKTFYDNPDYDWDLAPSMPDPILVNALTNYPSVNKLHVFKIGDKSEFKIFEEILRKYLDEQLTFKFAEKKVITEENFEEVFEYWNKKFGESVQNNFKPSRYFVTDIQENTSWYEKNEGRVYFKIGHSRKPIPKKITADDYEYFWRLYEKVTNTETARGILAKIDRITDVTLRKFFGEFFTPLPFAKKALEYIERTLGKNWWASGEYRLWDMAAGTGNLEYYLPQDALKYCYLSTLYQGDVEHLERLFHDAEIFQYNYLEDDVDNLFITKRSLAVKNGNAYDLTWKMPEKLRNDLNNPKLKWIVLINPPFATAQEAGLKGKSKCGVSDTNIRQRMHAENLGEVSREVYAQFLYRIKYEFSNKKTYLGLFAPLKYIISNNDQKFRDNVFYCTFNKGFTFSSANFHGTSKSSSFPVSFIVWNINKEKKLENQSISLDVFNESVEKIDVKYLALEHRNRFLSKWIERPPATIKFPPFGSAITIKAQNVDRRDRIAINFLASLMCKGNECQNQQYTAFLSGPYVSAGALSVTPENFEQAMVVFAARCIPANTWLNHVDQFQQPNRKLSQQFIVDCAIWSLFDSKNQTAALRNVKYEGKVYQIENHFFPFSVSELKSWIINDKDIKTTLRGTKNSFVADWILKKQISPTAKNVIDTAKKVYGFYFANIHRLRTPKFKIETYDAGWWQIRQSLQDVKLGADELADLKLCHDKLKEKLLKQLKIYGIIE
ncbi:MAG: hypothetical protein LBE18_11980 [Planctomycetaceae bacterium]|jgi:hypothetical protein|nr:hypothetical protein [Planctomycetaceae bacterium]